MRRRQDHGRRRQEGEGVRQLKEKTKQVIGACYGSALARRGVPQVVPALVALLKPGLKPSIAITIARAIAEGGLDVASEAKLLDELGIFLPCAPRRRSRC